MVAAVWAVAVVGALGSASAAGLGGLSSSTIVASASAVTGAGPTVVACDDFSRVAASGGALDNRPVQLPANCGNLTWSTHRGTWTIIGGQLDARTQNATASVAAGATDVAVEATLVNADGGGRAGGVAIDHTGATQVYLAGVVAAGSSAQLRLVAGGSVTTIAAVPATVGATTTVRLSRAGANVTLAVDGVAVLTHTLSAAEIATLAAGTRAGLYWAGGNSLRFTDFLVTTP